MSELKKSQKMKVAQLHEQIQKLYESYPESKNSPLGLKKVKNDPKIKPKS